MYKDLRNKTILVTGGLGFVGSNLVDRLIELGATVDVIDNLSSESASLDNGNHQTRFTFIESVNGISEVGAGLKYDAIFHLAARARIQPSFKTPMAWFDSNVKGTAEVMEFARQSGSGPVIYSTTSSSQHGKYISPYTAYKVMGEDILKTYANCFDQPCAIVTFYNVYGNREPHKGEWATVVAKFLRQWRSGELMTIVGTGEQKREFTSVTDIVNGLIHIWQYKGDKLRGDYYDLSGGKSYSILQLATLISGDDSTKYKFVPLRKNEGDVSYSNSFGTYLKTGWKAKEKLEDYISEQVNKK